MLFCSNAFALTTTTGTPSGGVYNGGFELGTGSGVNTSSTLTTIGDRNYGWIGAGSGTYNNTISYDATRYFTGLQSMKIDANSLDTTDVAVFNNGAYPGSTVGFSAPQYSVILKPSTIYKLSARVDVNKLEWTQLTGNMQPSAGCFVTEYNSSRVRVANTALSFYQATTTNNNFIYISDFGTTTSTSVIGIISCGARPYLSGTYSDGNVIAYFDDVRLEEVGSVNLTGQVSGRPSITVTGVSDFNAIDQADTNNGTTASFGDNNLYWAKGQCFTPTQNKFSGIIFQKNASAGTYIGNVTVSLRESDGTIPTGNALISYTYSNASWNALTDATDTTLYLPFTLDANGTKKYCIDFNSSTQDANNKTAIRADLGASYSGGTAVRWNGTTWIAGSDDLYFKTLFEKQSSAFDLNVCSSGDSVCDYKTFDIVDLNNGETYTINPVDAPLFYSGDNNVYFMMHSDSNYQNLTPSMKASLLYTFDKPTTTLTHAKGTTDNTENITLTCTNGTTGTCNQTYYQINGLGYNTYTNPFTLANGSYTFTYYSTDPYNQETTNTTTLTIPTQAGTPTCTLVHLFPILLIFLAINLIIGGVQFKKAIENGSIQPLIIYVIATIVGIVVIIQFLPILC